MKFFYCWIASCFFTVHCFAQPVKLPAEIPVNLYDSVNESHYEFSGLAKWRNKILLIPQHRSAKDKYHIVAIDTASIDSVLNGKTIFAAKTAKLFFHSSLDVLYSAIKQAILPRTDFGGFEAAVAVGDELFLTVETDSLCYVVKGTIDAQNMQVRFEAGDTMSLPKPGYSFGNAGFESIAYLPQQHKLLAVYENNAIPDAATAFSFTTGLQHKTVVTFAKPLLFRLTDIAFLQGNILLGINHSYRDYSAAIRCGAVPPDSNALKNEYCYYIAGNLAQATKEMHTNPQQAHFTRIVQIEFKNNILNWNEKKIISYSSDNWEGVLPYKSGILMVVDGRPPGVPCKLSYFGMTN